MNASYVRALKTLALRDVASEDRDEHYSLRHVARWYSKTFFTPLHIVLEEISVHDMLQHYFEAQFETMDDDDRQKYLQELSQDEVSWRKQQDLKEIEDAEEEKIMEQANLKTAARLAAQAAKKAAEQLRRQQVDQTEVSRLIGAEDQDVSMRFDK